MSCKYRIIIFKIHQNTCFFTSYRRALTDRFRKKYSRERIKSLRHCGRSVVKPHNPLKSNTLFFRRFCVKRGMTSF